MSRSVLRAMVSLALTAGLCIACGSDDPRQVTSSPSPTQASPSPSPNLDELGEPSDPHGLDSVLSEVDSYSFNDVPRRLARSQVSAIRASVKGAGKITDATVKEAIPEGDLSVVVTVAIVVPTEGASVEDLFGLILTGASTRGEPSPAAGGQAFRIKGRVGDIFLTPISTEPALLLLMVAGPKDAPGEEVVENILEANSAR